MRILCLIMVGAFLLTIAIADNGNAVRPNTESTSGQSTTTTTAYSAPAQPKPTSSPWTASRVTNSPGFQTAFNDRVIVEDHITMPTIPSTSHFFMHEAKALSSPVILEPMQRFHEKSWMDWMPDFFADESSHEPGPLIGPLELPGMGNQVYIRHKEPEDDDTEHVVVHLINREPPPFTAIYPQQLISHPPTQQILPQPSQINNQISYYNKDTAPSPDSSFSHPGKQILPYNYATNSLPYKLASGDPWKYQVAPSDKGVADAKSAYSIPEATVENSKEGIKSKVLLSEKQEFPSPGVVWNHHSYDRQSNYYGRSLTTSSEIKSPTESPFIPMSTHSSTNVTIANRIDGKSLSSSRSQYSTLPSYVYLNSTRATSESYYPAATSAEPSVSPYPPDRGSQDVIQRYDNLQQQRQRLSRLNYLDEITLVNKSNNHRRHVNTARAFPSIDNSLRIPRNRFSATQHFLDYNSTRRPQQHRKSIQRIDRGGIQVVQAPNLQNDSVNYAGGKEKLASPSNGSAAEIVMKSIMTMTASQKWKNVTDSNKKVGEAKKAASTPKPAVIQKRIDEQNDDNHSTKEDNRTTAVNKTQHVNEAVKKIMGSYAKWRHKVVTTDFVKELEKKAEKDKESKAAGRDSKS